METTKMLGPSRGGRSSTSIHESEFSTRNFNTYVTVFSINLSSRYPDVTNLTNIPCDDIRRLAELSVYCVPIVLDVWERTLEDRLNARRSAA